ncbi:MAG TPA: DUF6496 domain-containing protein [Polyangiaceae bacterium]|nr:DUF6496 domain-containing protein [Polyangiaceae bacterium]
MIGAWHMRFRCRCMATKRSSHSSRRTTKRSSSPSNKKRSSKRYGSAASKKVGRAMHEAKRGTLRSGRSKKKVTSRKQAIAIGLSEARRSGAKVPPKK